MTTLRPRKPDRFCPECGRGYNFKVRAKLSDYPHVCGRCSPLGRWGELHAGIALTLAKAKRLGLFPKRKPCEVCGDQNSVAHHEDYSKPLDVNWLCRRHHQLRHIEIRRANLEGAT